MPQVVISDTTVLMNVLDIPTFNQNREATLDRFQELIDAGADLLLRLGTVFEAGNHIAQLSDGRRRRRYAELLRDQVREALLGRA